MIKPLATAAAAALLLTALPATAGAGGSAGPRFTPGADGIGDPYYPYAGNGGYDAKSYDLALSYRPDTDEISGRATIAMRATQNLSSFNLDLDGLTVSWVKVNGVVARFSRDGGELTIVPRYGLRNGTPFTVVVAYHGVPLPVMDSLGTSGFFHTDDGAVIAGQPKVASTWYPVNDHPLDPASYRFAITVPAGLQAVANGVLQGSNTSKGWTTWRWYAKEPMASYLTTMGIGEFQIDAYRADGVKYWDTVDPDLYDDVFVPHSGTQMALSQQGQPTYKRLTNTFTPTAGDSTLTFWMNRDTELGWDFVFVEAHPVGSDDWTTLPAPGITTDDVAASCFYWPFLHPFVSHYQTLDEATGACSTTGSTGSWNTANDTSNGYEQWVVDLSGYIGSSVEVSITSMSDDLVQRNGVVVDDIDGPGTSGDTSFEADGNVMDGWTVPGAPTAPPELASLVPNENDWIAGTSSDGPPPLGAQIDASFGRQPEILEFLAGYFGPYPFSASGGIVDDIAGVGFALETQTRPIYTAREFFLDPVGADSVVVHEQAHQWFGDSLPLAGWQHIWLNEGFATYAEWLWSENEGLGTVDEIFAFWGTAIPPDDLFWQLPIGDPSPDYLFEFPVYIRGAMTLHTLRLEVGDHDFFKILRTWPTVMAGKNVDTPTFIRFAERVSGEQLDDLFNTWLFTPGLPALSAPLAASARTAEATTASTPAVAHAQMLRWGPATK